MAGERIELPLGEVCDVKQGRYLGPGDMSEVKTDQTPIPVIGANGILGYTHQVTYREPVTLVTCRGSNCGMLQRTSGPTWISNNAMACPPKKPHDSRYIHYVLQSTDFGEVITGSAQPQITTGHLNAKVITITRDSEEQKAIAAVLGALDDKIELNRRMNATLEAMARALFQSWFVDFDPVHAKLDGRLPEGMDAETAALFPAEIEESTIGHIPKGWEVARLGDVADVNWGDTNTTKASYVIDGFPAYSASGADGYLPRFDFERTGIVVSAIGANAGVTWLAHGKWSCIKNTLRFWATAPTISTEYLFFATYGREKWPQRGSAQPFISQGDARGMKVIAPSEGLSERFGSIVRPLLYRIEANISQSRTLATLRDTLLPKLLSGEIRAAKTN